MVGRALADPKVRLGGHPKTCHIGMARHAGRNVGQEAVADGREGQGVEGLALGKVADVDAGVVDHGVAFQNRIKAW